MRKNKDDLLITESLATKFRPLTFDHLVGQEAVAVKLKGMVKSKKFPSAFLITGNSGCGKTTVSQMINRYVNCETYSACGECDSCTKSNHPDFMSFNVGDTRGIDDVRSIINSSKLMPRHHKRVIMLDEVHALTPQAATCLLVPLENPSSNTIWILATTNPEKLLPTIIGRCHRFDLRPIKEKTMIKRLLYIAKKEGVDFRAMDHGIESLELLASLTNGQMRDAIQMLESVIFAIRSGDKIDPKILMSKYVANFSVDIEKLAAKTVYAVMKQDLKTMLSCVVGNQDSRSLMSKMRWLIQYLLAEYVGKAQYQPYAARYFFAMQEKTPIKIKYSQLLMLQSALTQAEITMNSSPIDANVVLLSALGTYMREM